MPRTQAIGLIIVALLLGFVVGFKWGRHQVGEAETGVVAGSAAPPPAGTEAPATETEESGAAGSPANVSASTPATGKRLPRLVDLGSTTCIPCQMMAPILEELKKEYAGLVEVEVIDVNKRPEAADQYQINVIPTQILFDKDGKEVFRHEGFIPKEELLEQFKKIGVPVRKAAASR